MSKEDRYSHLGDGPDDGVNTGTDARDADDAREVASSDETEEKENEGTSRRGADEESSEGAGGIRVTMSDGSKEVEVHVEDEGLTIDDLENSVEDVFDDLSEEKADDGGESVQSLVNGSTTSRSPVVRGIRVSGSLTRAILRSGSIGLSAGGAWMVALLRRRRRDN